jgi:hypothetical protein
VILLVNFMIALPSVRARLPCFPNPKSFAAFAPFAVNDLAFPIT